MKRALFILTLFALTIAACRQVPAGGAPAPSIGAITPPFVDPGIDPESWAVVPAGTFPYGQHDHMTMVDYDYEIMVTNVTNEQYASFLNAALAAGAVRLGEVEVEAGEQVWVEVGAYGFTPAIPSMATSTRKRSRPATRFTCPRKLKVRA